MSKRVEFEGFKFDLELPSNIDTEIDAGHWFDKDVAIWIKQYIKPGMVAIDAGANWGLFTVLMASLAGEEGEVFAWEPSIYFYKRLVKHLNLNESPSVTAIHTALADQECHVICCTEGPPYKSSARIDYERKTIEHDEDELVSCQTLDTSGWPLAETLDFVKIDVDGSEHRLLLGAEKTIETHRPVIVIEAEVGESGYMPVDWLADRGYTFEIYPDTKVDRSYVRQQQGKGVGTVNLLALPG